MAYLITAIELFVQQLVQVDSSHKGPVMLRKFLCHAVLALEISNPYQVKMCWEKGKFQENATSAKL